MQPLTRHITLSTLLLCLSHAPVQAKSLYELYQLAQKSEPSFQIAALERDAARERYLQAKSAFKPSASAQANLNKGWNGEFESTSDSIGYTLSLNYHIYNRSRDITLTQSERAIEKVESNYQSAEQGLSLQVAQLYFDVLRAIDNLVFSRVAKEAIKKQLEQSEQRFEVGLIAITDVQESQAGYDLAIADEIQAQNALDTAYEALREVVGEYHQDLDILRDDIPLLDPDPANMEKWVESAIENNPALAAAQYDVEIAKESINLRRAENYPIVAATASHGYTDQSSNGFGSDGFDHSVGLAVQMPFDLSGRLGAQTREAQIQYTQALDSLEKQRRQIQTEVRSAYLNVQSGISRVKALKQAVVSNETAYSATQTGFEVGTRTSVDVLNARQALLNAQRNYSNARYIYIVNTLLLKQAAGLLQAEDLEKLSEWLKPVAAGENSLDLVEARTRTWEKTLEKRRQEEVNQRLAEEEAKRLAEEAKAAEEAARALEEQNRLDSELYGDDLLLDDFAY